MDSESRFGKLKPHCCWNIPDRVFESHEFDFNDGQFGGGFMIRKASQALDGPLAILPVCGLVFVVVFYPNRGQLRIL